MYCTAAPRDLQELAPPLSQIMSAEASSKAPRKREKRSLCQKKLVQKRGQIQDSTRFLFDFASFESFAEALFTERDDPVDSEDCLVLGRSQDVRKSSSAARLRRQADADGLLWRSGCAEARGDRYHSGRCQDNFRNVSAAGAHHLAGAPVVPCSYLSDSLLAGGILTRLCACAHRWNVRGILYLTTLRLVFVADKADASGEKLCLSACTSLPRRGTRD